MGAWTALIAAGTSPSADGEDRMDSLIAAASPLRQITAIDTAQGFRRILSIPILGGIFKLLARPITNIIRGTRVGELHDAQYCPIDVAAKIKVPVLLIYQEYDMVIKTNTQDAVEMYQALPEPKDLLLLAGPGHIFELASFQKLYQVIEHWFESTLA
jgi:pimeloyl-ACP methyl ester carboxylesterase